MKRDGFALAGGIVAVARGVLGTVLGISALGTLQLGESLFPGYSAVIIFEFALSILLIPIGIFVILKSADRAAGTLIRALGFVVIAAAVIDIVWAIIVLGGNAVSSGFGSLVVLGVIGSLLVTGGTRLARPVEPSTVVAPPAE